MLPEFIKNKTDAWDAHFGTNVIVVRFQQYPVDLKDVFLLEAITYDDKIYVLCTKRVGNTIHLEAPETTSGLNSFDDVGLSLITTSDEPYRSLLNKSIEYYSRTFKNIHVAYYGDNPPAGVNCKCFGDEFHMSQARNRSLQLVDQDFCLQIDTGMLISDGDITNLFKRVQTHPIVHLKMKQTSGNGNYFGSTVMMKQNGYCESFKKFWYEDTEYLMNFSRIGIVPDVQVMKIDEMPHRGKGGSVNNNNKEVFRHILLNGRTL
jgi:hypothetical protein